MKETVETPTGCSRAKSGHTAKSLKAMGWTPPHPIGINVPDWKCRLTSRWRGGVSMKLIRVGVDLAKNVFHLHGASSDGRVVFRKKLTRGQLERFIASQPPCVAAMEACGSAHFWARRLGSVPNRIPFGCHP